MNVDGGDYAAGARRLHDEMCLSDDTVIVTAHGTSTHVDALAHAWRGDVLYNGHEARKILSFGAARCGIDKMGGVAARGVLFDVAGHLGVPFLDESVAIDADLLRECLDASGQELRPGDVAVVRTGWPTVFETDEARYQGGQPGLAYDGAHWLAEQDVCMIACDNSGVGQIAMDGTFAAPLDEDVHLLCLWERGIPLAEMLWLEELATYGQKEFLFVLAPLTIVGGTASPVNPLAIL
jgi:kynurenine formamidase